MRVGEVGHASTTPNIIILTLHNMDTVSAPRERRMHMSVIKVNTSAV